MHRLLSREYAADSLQHTIHCSQYTRPVFDCFSLSYSVVYLTAYTDLYAYPITRQPKSHPPYVLLSPSLLPYHCIASYPHRSTHSRIYTCTHLVRYAYPPVHVHTCIADTPMHVSTPACAPTDVRMKVHADASASAACILSCTYTCTYTHTFLYARAHTRARTPSRARDQLIFARSTPVPPMHCQHDFLWDSR
jgi:hypothetical protein